MQPIQQNPNQSNFNQSSQLVFNPNAQITSSTQQKPMEAFVANAEAQSINTSPGYHSLHQKQH